jgi:hypothetical protein
MPSWQILFDVNNVWLSKEKNGISNVSKIYTSLVFEKNAKYIA